MDRDRDESRFGPRKRVALALFGTLALLAILRPGIASLNVWRGEQLALNHANERGIMQFRRAVFLDPTYANAYRSLATLLDREGRADEAIDAFKRSLELEPDFSPTRQHLVAMLILNERFPEAVEHADILVEMDGTLPGQWFILAKALEAVGETDEALATWEEAAERFPDRDEITRPQIERLKEGTP